MKRILCCLVCLILLASFVGCNADNNTTSLRSGDYYAVGDYEEMLTPYLFLNADENEFALGPGTIMSYAEIGTYKEVEGKIIATSQSTTFQFDIKDENTLILIDTGDSESFKTLLNTQFVFSEDFK